MTETTLPPDDPTPQTPPPKAPRSGKRLRWALGLSLALNLLVAGVLAGAVIASMNGHDRKGGPPGLSGFGQGAGPVVQSFEPQDRRAIAREMRRGAQELGLSRRNVVEGMQTLANQLAANPYDHSVVETTLTAQMGQVKEVQDLAVRVILDRISQLSDEDRVRLAQDLELRAKEVADSKPPARNRN